MQVKIHKPKDEAHEAAIDKTVTVLIERALAHGATDIHIEPRTRNVAVRFRIDGWLQEVNKLPLETLNGIVKNVKRRGGLDDQLRATPQSGSFVFDSDQIKTSIDVATMPTVTGEKITLRLTRQLSEPATLEALGFWGDTLGRIERGVAEPHGLVLAASMYHTGTTMTLLGVVHLLNNPALNIVTLEDPIEHQIAGINQTQINATAGVTFRTGLQALLRQDPNVVMVSDLREMETVQAAVQASLSGRLLLGGMHAVDAAHAIARLLNMHIEPFLVATATRLTIGQRFLRRLCPVCAEAYEPDESVRKDLRSLLHSCGVTSLKTVHELELSALQHGLGSERSGRDLSSTGTNILRLFRANPEGCPHCRFTGYSGRLGICEVLTTSESMEKLIAANADVPLIRKHAIAEGMIPLGLDGFIKALRGYTTLEEVLPLGIVA